MDRVGLTDQALPVQPIATRSSAAAVSRASCNTAALLAETRTLLVGSHTQAVVVGPRQTLSQRPLLAHNRMQSNDSIEKQCYTRMDLVYVG